MISFASTDLKSAFENELRREKCFLLLLIRLIGRSRDKPNAAQMCSRKKSFVRFADYFFSAEMAFHVSTLIQMMTPRMNSCCDRLTSGSKNWPRGPMSCRTIDTLPTWQLVARGEVVEYKVVLWVKLLHSYYLGHSCFGSASAWPKHLL